MCWKRNKPEPITEVLPHVKRRIVTLGRNLYVNAQELKGCWNDSLNWSGKTLGMYSDFDVRKFRDYDATRERYLADATAGVRSLNPGATVLVIADSCFSETLTRGSAQMTKNRITTNRFYDTGLPPGKIVRRITQPVELNHIVMSACLENETASDAYINGQWAGAFTFFSVMALQLGMTYRQWYAEIRKFLPSADFTQTPTIEGPDYLLDRKVFEDETLVIHNSSHGSNIQDTSGDEWDGRDETIYLDRHVVDDEIKIILQQIPQ